MKSAFRIHPKARLFDGQGEVGLTVGAGGVLADAPLAAALGGAFGGPFRIGGDGDLQVGVGAFETLTSGSSGQPRRILRSMASWTASFAVNAGLFGIGPGVRVGVLGRLVHSLSLYAAIEGLHLGAEVHVLDALRPDRQRLARQVAGSEAVVLLRGPSGTGKTVLAKALHQWSRRAERPFGVVSCPSLSAELLESAMRTTDAGGAR